MASDHRLYICIDGRMVEVKSKTPIVVYDFDDNTYTIRGKELEAATGVPALAEEQQVVVAKIIEEASTNPAKSREYFGYDVKGKDASLYALRPSRSVYFGHHLDVFEIASPLTVDDNFVKSCLESESLFELENKLENLIAELWKVITELAPVKFHPNVLRSLVTAVVAKAPHVYKHFRTLMFKEVFETQKAPKTLDLIGYFFYKLENKARSNLKQNKKLKRMVSGTEANKEEENGQRERVEAKNRLEFYIFQCKTTAEEERAKAKLSESDRNLVLSKAEDTIKWLDANQLADKGEFEHREKELEAVCSPIFSKLCRQ